ncbi:MAG: hypothetical protein O8C67_09610 [Candidatus Methanoperedens sp.]|nr:hypothetical protein [Candidatus Methanoperedens sp.]
MTYMFRFEHKVHNDVSAVVTADTEDEALTALDKVVVVIEDWEITDSEEIEDNAEGEE